MYPWPKGTASLLRGLRLPDAQWELQAQHDKEATLQMKSFHH